ncbi:MAG TPA: FecR domain-containing protein [Luteimonas sp.]|nr:FecR domain-containing protein [Luteimonas sp.]
MSQEHDIDRDDYLWDRSGPVDLEIARLERLLAPYALGDARRTPRASVARPRRRRGWRIALASAAVLAMFAVGAGTWYRQRLSWPEAQPWRMAVNGPARIDGRDASAARSLAPGSVLETGKDASVRLRAARIGEIVLGEDSRFSLVETRSGRHRVSLQQGSLWARVWAPPGSLGVDTRHGDVLDLGCEFVLKSAADGSGSLEVRSGWVQIDGLWWETLVPQGARIEFRGDGPPGTPYDVGASAEFVAALREVDAQGRDVSAIAPAVRRLAAQARPQDAITLLSLLKQNPRLGEGPVFDRLAAIMPAGAVVTREDLRRRGPRALGPWWDRLPYPRIKRWWMQWPDAFSTKAPAEVLFSEQPR